MFFTIPFGHEAENEEASGHPPNKDTYKIWTELNEHFFNKCLETSDLTHS